MLKVEGKLNCENFRPMEKRRALYYANFLSYNNKVCFVFRFNNLFINKISILSMVVNASVDFKLRSFAHHPRGRVRPRDQGTGQAQDPSHRRLPGPIFKQIGEELSVLEQFEV